MVGMECRLDRITVHYESFGEGRPVIVLPGWPDDGRVPADYLEPVFDRRPGWRRLYLDLPGRGRTKGESWITTNDQILDIVLEVIDRIVAGERLVLAGHSAGGYLARAVLHRRADDIDGLLQVVSVIGGADEAAPEHVTLVPDPALIKRMEAELGTELTARFAGSMVVQTTALYERYKSLLPAFTGSDSAFLDQLEDELSFQVDPPPIRFERPALFILGRQDAVVGYRGVFELMNSYPRATVAILDRAGHTLPWEQEQLFRALVDEWLGRVEEVANS
jgi:pimeloyl-ACP methyl ester carboxylesterase